MEPGLVFLLVLTGIQSVNPSVPRKYYLIQQAMTWDNAKAYCRSHHHDLAIIDSETNLVRVKNIPEFKQCCVSTWIGLYRYYYTWFWSYDNEELGSAFWRTTEPNNWGGVESCAGISPTGWYDNVCSFQSHFMCFDDRNIGTNKYIYYSTPKNWSAAQSYCRMNHMDLASSRNSTEDSVLLNKVSREIWFGLYRNSWRWMDLSLMSTIDFKPGQPDNYYGNELCGYINQFNVVDSQCTGSFPFLCHRDVTAQQQILELKVQSDQKLNDPAVLAAIEEKMQQKMKDLGLENITVKLRKQSDGTVFQ